MHPVLFTLGKYQVYSYGFMIAWGALFGGLYMAFRGKKELGLSFDQANTLFLLLFFSAFLGGKIFLVFEDGESRSFISILSGSGFVFYGSFLFSIPAMMWYFKKNHLPTWQMLDIMAMTTLIVHFFGRIGCFLAGCCYGLPTSSWLGITFHHEASVARPLFTPLHPTQLYEASFLGIMLTGLFMFRDRKKFHGQLFLGYLILYALGRVGIEFFRGDEDRGYLVGGLSNAQFIALLLALFSTVMLIRKWGSQT